eukprot:gene11756-biopygen16103
MATSVQSYRLRGSTKMVILVESKQIVKVWPVCVKIAQQREIREVSDLCIIEEPPFAQPVMAMWVQEML